MRFGFASLLACLFAACLFASPGAEAATPRTELIGKLPLRFEENRGRDPHRETRYVAQGPNFSLGLAPAATWLEWKESGKTALVHTRLRGANPNARIEPENRLPGLANYLIGASDKWQTGVPGFERVRYRDVYPGIDFVFHGEQGRLEYDFILAPGADPRRIQLDLDGQRTARVSEQGDLIVSTEAGDLSWKKPEIYQDVDGSRRAIDGRFVVAGNRVRFELGSYDRRRTLVIDPTLSYMTYLGGSIDDMGRGIALDAAGNVYIGGATFSPDLPTTASVFQPNFGGRTANRVLGGDGFVAKFSPTGSLLYLTYIGGSRDEAIYGIAVDQAGNAYVAGSTTSFDFPTVNAYQSQFGGFGGNGAHNTGDAFVAKLSPNGDRLLYSTYLGGNRDDIAMSIAIDSAGEAYITGATLSANFPHTDNSRLVGVGGQPIRPCCGVPLWDTGDAFVAKFDPSGKLLFSTFLGGTQDDIGVSIALDSNNNAYIGGCTISFDFPTTAGAYQRAFGGIEGQNFFQFTGDAFVTKYDPNGKVLYSTYFGGTGDDCITGIAVDSTGAAYITGATTTQNLPTSAGAFQPAYAGYKILPLNVEQLIGDAFVAKLNPSGSGLMYLSYLGGSTQDSGGAIAVDAVGDAFVTGFTNSTDFPVTSGALQPKFAGNGILRQFWEPMGDAFLAVVNPTGTTLLYSSYFGGSGDEVGTAIALDGKGSAYLTGGTRSPNMPVTPNAKQASIASVRPDIIYAVFSGFPLGPPVITSVANAFGDSPILAPNTWVAIKGTGLSTTSRTWQDSDFRAFNGQMPTNLDGTAVTMSGKNAYTYFVDQRQINVLTPPDLPPGPVQVRVTTAGLQSQPFTSQPPNGGAQAESISFFVFNGGPYVIATHLDGSLIGPPSLFPGFSTPAKPGETIIVYANGFGPTTTPVTPGSATQSGTLGTTPPLQIGGSVANVSFAGLISPGLFQFNVQVPAGLPDGDAKIQSEYAGQVTQAGTLITIQH